MTALVGSLYHLMMLRKGLVLVSAGLLEAIQHGHATAGRVAIDSGSMALLMALVVHSEGQRGWASRGRVG